MLPINTALNVSSSGTSSSDNNILRALIEVQGGWIVSIIYTRGVAPVVYMGTFVFAVLAMCKIMVNNLAVRTIRFLASPSHNNTDLSSNSAGASVPATDTVTDAAAQSTGGPAEQAQKANAIEVMADSMWAVFQSRIWRHAMAPAMLQILNFVSRIVDNDCIIRR